MTAVVIIQARMGSSRLPGKTLESLGESTVLDWVTRRTVACPDADAVVVATSNRPEDDAIEDYLRGSAIDVVRGSASDVLDRYRQAVEKHAPDIVVRVTADCPFIATQLVSAAIETVTGGDADYASTHLDGRFCRGLDIEAVRAEVLLDAARLATDEVEREHVTPYVYRRPETFKCVPIVAPEWAREPGFRFTLDERDDLKMLRAVVAEMPADIESNSADIVAFLSTRPDIVRINADVAHRTV